MSTTREAGELCARILQNPDGMVLWLKFANDKPTINSACTDDFLIQLGDPQRLPKGRGLYRNWGMFFDFGDVLEVPGGIKVPSVLMKQWTISFWMILPLTMYNTSKKHVLVQNCQGTGAYVEIDETATTLQVIDEHTGEAVEADIDLSAQKKGWHNFIVTCDNTHPGCKGEIKFYLSGK